MSDVLIFNSITDFRNYRSSAKGVFGVVPTMGALHVGHGHLIQKSARENDVTVLTIYVNPTQFNNTEDLEKYPRTWEADLELAKKFGAHVVLAPKYQEIYPDQYRYKLTESDFSKILCGLHRPGHFDGVLTIVMKLLQITQADNSYFGEKDFQQFQLIKQMAEAFFVKTKVIGVKTVREIDGLAMSSRNMRLTAVGRKQAPLIYKALTEAKSSKDAIRILNAADIQVEYLEEHNGRRYVAAIIDGVRLIDNVEI